MLQCDIFSSTVHCLFAAAMPCSILICFMRNRRMYGQEMGRGSSNYAPEDSYYHLSGAANAAVVFHNPRYQDPMSPVPFDPSQNSFLRRAQPKIDPLGDAQSKMWYYGASAGKEGDANIITCADGDIPEGTFVITEVDPNADEHPGWTLNIMFNVCCSLSLPVCVQFLWWFVK